MNPLIHQVKMFLLPPVALITLDLSFNIVNTILTQGMPLEPSALNNYFFVNGMKLHLWLHSKLLSLSIFYLTSFYMSFQRNLRKRNFLTDFHLVNRTLLKKFSAVSCCILCTHYILHYHRATCAFSFWHLVPLTAHIDL